MIMVDESKINLKGEKITKFEDMVFNSQVTYMEGNCHFITQFLKLSVAEPRIAFHGDQYASDIYWSNQLPNWDGIAVIEEIS